LKLVDFYGASFTAFILAIGELYAFSYIYGVDRLCRDIEFMLGFRPNFYWRVCWKFLTPGLMTAILLYFFAVTKTLPQAVDGNSKTGFPGIDYPTAAHVMGFCITCLGLIPLPLFAVYAIIKQKESTVWRVSEKLMNLFIKIGRLRCLWV
jgi:solute carrier family 6 amino acid transporter-like protein 5/7/9/14